MGIFRVVKKNLSGEIIQSYAMNNIVLNAGLKYLCQYPNSNFNTAPSIGVGSSDISTDINQVDLISPIAKKTAVFSANSSTVNNPQGDKTFTASLNFAANEAIGDLSEIAYYMNDGVPLNRTLFSVPGQLDTRFVSTPELDQSQVVDISNLNQVSSALQLSQTFTVGASGGGTAVADISEVAISCGSSGNPSQPLNVSIYSDNAGAIGTLLGQASIPAFAEPVQRWRIATFASPINVSNGAVCHLVVSSATDLADCYDVYSSLSDVYSYGQLSISTNGGTSYSPASPSQDLGFKTYYSTSGATAYDYALSFTQFNKETVPSPIVSVNEFPVNNLDSTSTSQGTVRLTLPEADELPTFVEQLNIYKTVNGNLELLTTTGTNREYFYDNGSLATTSQAPAVSSVITSPNNINVVLDNTNGGPLQLGYNKYYKISSLLMGNSIASQEVGPFVHPAISGNEFYDSAYPSIPVPLGNVVYETAASSEVMAVSPSTNQASFTEYFTGSQLSSSLWTITNDNSDYYSILTPQSTGESQLQLQIPAGVPFVIASTKQARAGQSYYVNVAVPFVSQPKPATVYNSSGQSSPNPLFTDEAPNRVPLFSFVNPNNIQNESSDKRLTLEVGMYHEYRTDDDITTGDTSSTAHLPMFCLYDNVGNTYFFSTNDIKPSHSDGSYTFRIDIDINRVMTISALNVSDHSFHVLTSSVVNGFSFTTQFNGSHVVQNGQPGPTNQTTGHFIVPETYSFAIGNPSNDPLSFVNAQYIATSDSIYTISGLSPSVPVPAIAMTVNGSIVNTAGGYGATLSWNAVPGVRKYNVYATQTSGSYENSNGNLVATYDTYYPCYAVQSTDSVNNDFYSGLVAVTNNVRSWQNVGVTYGIDSTTTGTTNGYALGGFVGSTEASYGNPLVPSISQALGSAEGYLLLLTEPNQKALFTFTGGGFALFAETGPDRGIGALYIDGNFVQNIDFYTEGRLEQQEVFSTSGLTPGYHTATIQPAGIANDFSLGQILALDYFVITVPAFVDTNQLFAGTPLTTNDPHVLPVPAPSIKGIKTYNGNGPTILTKGSAHTLEVSLTFSLINPNI